MGPRLEKLAPDIVWEPCVNGSIFRVYRDIRFSKEALARYRARLTKAGYEIHGKTYKLPPRGFNGNVAAQVLVLHSSLSAGVERKSPLELASPKFVAYCVKEWKKLLSLHRWLIDKAR